MLAKNKTVVAELRSALDLPDIFDKIANSEKLPLQLDIQCQATSLFFKYSSELGRFKDDIKNYIPLWETNGEFVVAFDQNREVFVHLYYEDISEYHLGKTYQQFISSILTTIYESGALFEELTEISELFGFKHLEALMIFCEDENGCLEEFNNRLPD